ncbi:cysteine hydrolase [Lysobacter sp. K5869]|uniref:isochorismatase family cysteine hydrolase n=1 Tax=Lysobacter sp. K5869 TaxID=2820808 RepID=UPI001C060FBC|nr:isochorismatase family cysteine hydrolase [Lysobacter sp. K5869]QWP78053.1 cysteine hydrolase [Lysobacter sp. K5869]
MNTALIVIDPINDIVHPDGKIARSAAQVRERGLIERVNALSRRARAAHAPVVLIRVAFAPGYADLPKRSPLFGRAAQLGALREGDWGTRFHERLETASGDWAIVKPRVSAFFGTALEARLRAAGVTRVVLCGVSTETGVQTTARDAHDRDFEVIVAGDACASAEARVHEAALEMLGAVARVMGSEQIAFDEAAQ